MLDITNSVLRTDASRMEDLASGLTKVEEGQLLKTVMESGVAKVTPTTGATGEVVAGFALSTVMDVTKLPFLEEVTIPASAPYTVTLAKTPVGSVAVRQTDGTAFTEGTVATTVYSISGRTLTFHADDAGKTLRIGGTYEPTLTEARAFYGEAINENPHGSTGRTGVVFGADILWTTNYDPASDWWKAAPGPVYSGANGTITLDDSGTEVAGVTVVAAPTAANAMIGLRVSL